MNNNKTIFALSTAKGKSAIAVMRISGDRAKNVMADFCNIKQPKARHSYYGNIINPQDKSLIDDAIAVYFKGPYSYTGEDILELNIHGSNAVINLLSDALTDYGIVPAVAGEFSTRAFYNQKMDLTRLEGVADLINAQTKLQAKQALKQLSGNLYNLYNGWKAKLLRILALLEAFIDFPEEEIPAKVIQDANDIISQIEREIQAHLNNRAGEIINNGYVISIIGRPNAGKSSLINALAKREMAIVSDIAGTTRDTIELNMDIDGYPVTFIDTAGISEASEDAIEQLGIIKAREKAENSDMVIYLVNENIDEIPAMNDKERLIIQNKIDIYGKIEQADFYISVKDSATIDNLLEYLASKLADIIDIDNNDNLITRARYRSDLLQACENIQHYHSAIANNEPLELVTENIRLTARYIGRIIGNIDIEDILGEIFSNFCIGK